MEKETFIRQLLEEYDIETAEDIQDALKDLLGGTIKEMMEAEMDDHLGYENQSVLTTMIIETAINAKQVNSRYGSMEIEVPQDRKSTFEPQIVKKRQKDISDIDQKIISMYAKGMTTRQISETIEDIYGFEASESFISDVTDKILPQIEDWQNRHWMRYIRSFTLMRSIILCGIMESSVNLQLMSFWVFIQRAKRKS